MKEASVENAKEKLGSERQTRRIRGDSKTIKMKVLNSAASVNK